MPGSDSAPSLRTLPQWAPRVPHSLIYRLYHLDSQGIYDDELLDEAGYALYSRCRSFIDAMQAVRGRVVCPNCSQIVAHNAGKDETLHCTCGWSLPWGDYFATIQHRQLSGASPVIDLFQRYVDRFPAASTLQAKMLLIDHLLHGFHWNQKYGLTRPVAVNLLEGRLSDVIRFLDQLSYGPSSTPGIQETLSCWVANSRNARTWAFKEPHNP